MSHLGRPRKVLAHPFPLGQVHDSTLEPPRQVLGQAANPLIRSRSFELCLLANGSPCIQSNQSGNFWLIGWDTLIRMAISEGIEREVKHKHRPMLVDVTGRPISFES